MFKLQKIFQYYNKFQKIQATENKYQQRKISCFVCLKHKLFQLLQSQMASKLFQKNQISSMESIVKVQAREDNSVNKIELGKLFHLVKHLMKELSSQNKGSSHRKQLQNILEHIVIKITSNQKLGLDKFIAFFSITVYVNISVQTKEVLFNYGNNFYHNVCCYISKIINSWNAGSSIEQIDHISKSNLSILLCSLASIVQEQKNHLINLKTQKILTPAIIKLLLCLRLPNEQKLMRHYKSLVLYFDEHPIKGASKKLLIQSLRHHLVNCDVMKGAQLACVYMLNRMLDCGETEESVCSKWSNSQKSQILLACLKLMPFCANPSQAKMTMRVFQRVVVTMQKIEDTFINGELVLYLFEKVYNKPKASDRMSSSFKNMVAKLSATSRQLIFGKLIADNDISVLSLEIIQSCLLQMSSSFLILVVQSGYFQKLLSIYAEITEMSYKKYVLFKSINNIIKNSQCNTELSCILKKLSEYTERGNNKFTTIAELENTHI